MPQPPPIEGLSVPCTTCQTITTVGQRIFINDYPYCPPCAAAAFMNRVHRARRGYFHLSPDLKTVYDPTRTTAFPVVSYRETKFRFANGPTLFLYFFTDPGKVWRAKVAPSTKRDTSGYRVVLADLLKGQEPPECSSSTPPSSHFFPTSAPLPNSVSP